MHKSTKDLMDCVAKACEGPLCAEAIREDIDALMARIRDAQVALREVQDRCRAMAASEPDETVRGRMEPYAQISRGMDREIEKFAQSTIGLLDLLKEFERTERATRAEIEAGLSDDTVKIDPGVYHIPRAELSTAADVIAKKVRERVAAWIEKGGHDAT